MKIWILLLGVLLACLQIPYTYEEMTMTKIFIGAIILTASVVGSIGENLSKPLRVLVMDIQAILLIIIFLLLVVFFCTMNSLIVGGIFCNFFELLCLAQTCRYSTEFNELYIAMYMCSLLISLSYMVICIQSLLIFLVSPIPKPPVVDPEPEPDVEEKSPALSLEKQLSRMVSRRWKKYGTSTESHFTKSEENSAVPTIYSKKESVLPEEYLRKKMTIVDDLRNPDADEKIECLPATSMKTPPVFHPPVLKKPAELLSYFRTSE